MTPLVCGRPRQRRPTTSPTRDAGFQARVASWVGTSVISWSAWATTGAPTGLPHGSADHGHLLVSLGMWPAYLMICGLIDVARVAYATYAAPVIDASADSR